jgi:Carbohydrate-selective porin, OprB family
MSSAFWKSVLISPVILGIAMLASTRVMATPVVTTSNLVLNKASGATPVRIAAGETTPASSSVETTTDIVKPGDWQYTALQNLATKYGCNPNFNNQPVSQADFAQGLNTCLNKIEPILAQRPSIPPAPPAPTSTPSTGVSREDLEVLKRLTQEYRAQLSEINGRLAASDKKIAQLQANQFSTTTKLKGEVIFNITGAVSGFESKNTVFGDRVRLLFESSFNGQDKLWTRLATGNQPGINSSLLSNGTGTTSEGSQVSEGIPFGTANAVGIDWLAYQFPLGKASVYVPAVAGLHADYAATYGSNFEDVTGGSGALSSFAESSPIYKIGGGAGIGVTLPVADQGLTGISVGYLAGTPNSPSAGAGLFNGDYALLGQLNFKLGDKLDAGLTYVNSYHTGTNPIYGFGAGLALTGTSAANSGSANTNANSYGAQFVYKATDTLAFNGFLMNTSANTAGVGKRDIWSYGAGVSLPNFDGKGNLIGLLVGTEPHVGGAGTTPYHLEGFYKYKYSDNLSITPGLIYLTAPNSTSGNSAVIGVVRTTFTF